jgi:hypothetical protein
VSIQASVTGSFEKSVRILFLLDEPVVAKRIFREPTSTSANSRSSHFVLILPERSFCEASARSPAAFLLGSTG